MILPLALTASTCSLSVSEQKKRSVSEIFSPLVIQSYRVVQTTGTTGFIPTTASTTAPVVTTRGTNSLANNEKSSAEGGNSGIIGGLVAGWVISCVLLLGCFGAYILIQKRKQSQSYATRDNEMS